MRNKKKPSYHQKQIEALKERVKVLEQENKTLKQEKFLLTKINETNHAEIEKLKEEHKKAIEEYSIGLAEAENIKAQYKEAIQSAYKIKNEYAEKVQPLIKRLKKQV